MRGVFWRIFGWYMASSVVIIGAGFLYVYLTDPDVRSISSVSLSSKALERQASDAVKAWQTGGNKAVHMLFIGNTRPRFLFDSSGNEITGNVPAPVGLDGLVKRTLSSNKTVEWAFFPPETYTAAPVMYGGRRFVYVRTLPQDIQFEKATQTIWTRVAIGLVTSTIIWMLLANFVASPISQLRAVTKEFAAGNLAVRIGNQKPFNRGDEFSDLAHDIDQMAAQLQIFLDRQQRLLGDISHELRSPLSRLQLALEIARRRSGTGAEEALDRIEIEAERLNSLIGQILRSAKTEVDPGAKKLFDLSNLIRDVVSDADFEASARDRHVVIRNNEPSLIHGDREVLRSAIENVVRNAIRHTPGRTDVTIDLQQVEGTHAVVTVRDRGPGVPEDSIPLLFQPFYRVNDSRDRNSGGAGLGLAITQHAVAAHGGMVRANNCREGGFEVQIELPMKIPEVARKAGITFRDSPAG